MSKEDLELILDILKDYPNESREIKKLIDKITIFVERHNLDETYQKGMQDLATRLQNLDPIEENDNN